MAEASEMPTGDELAAQFEAFLAEKQDRNDRAASHPQRLADDDQVARGRG